MISMYNAGLMQKYVSDYEDTYTPRCNNDAASTTPVIDIPDVVLLFYFLLAASLISLLIQIAEFLWARVKLNWRFSKL